MQTWIDAETNRVLNAIDELSKADQRAFKRYIDDFGVLTLLARHLDYLSQRAATVNDDFRDIGLRLAPFGIFVPDTGTVEMGMLAPMMLPFFAPESTTDDQGEPFTTVALRPTRDLIDDLADAKPPKGSATTVIADMHKGIWYADFPHGALRLGEYQVRAAFTYPVIVTGSNFSGKGLHIACILTRLNTDKCVARMHWSLRVDGEDFIISEPQGYAKISDVDWDVVREQVSQLLCLLALYRSTADKAERDHVPLITERDLMRHPQNRIKRHKKFSLFRVETLAPPKDRFGRGERNGAGADGWKLGWRTPVRGHFKMQPHGPRNSLRKLIWVGEFERAKDKPVRPTIERLDVRPLDLPKDMPLPSAPTTPPVPPLGL